MNTDKDRFGFRFLVLGFRNRFRSSASLRLCVFFLLAAHCSLLTAQPRDFTRWVNPFIGTGGHGHTFPGATLPFGMVQLSPDTRIDNWDGSSGYHYSDDIIYGFSHTHLSGTGIPDGCDILFMPAIAEYESPERTDFAKFPGYSSKFSHSDEVAQPGYYSVKLADRKINAELTATQRVGFHRYTFPQSRKGGISLDLKWRDRLIDGDVKITGNKRVEGYRRSSSWAKNQTVYFAAEFSRTFDEVAIGSTGDKTHWSFFAFSPKLNDQVLLKVAISFVSIEGARKNLEAELPHWDFDKVRRDAKAAWNKELSKIEVSGGTPDQTTNFYTALYHTMIHPIVFNDVDGKYRGHDGKIHQLPWNADAPVRNEGGARKNQYAGGTGVGGRGRPRSDQYTVFSLWDTFRAAHPLYTIIDQKRTVDFINTFIRIYEQGGRLPVWELWGEETDTMIGYHATSVIADAMAKRIKGFDYEKAYKAAKHSAELDHFGLAAYKRRGYISMEDENESVSRTLEYAYNDWCIAQMAEIVFYGKYATSEGFLAKKDLPKRVYDQVPELRDIEIYKKRARYFENLFDPNRDFFVPRKNGNFIWPFAPNEVTFSFTEGNSWQYSFFVPHDIDRLIELMGPEREYFAGKLVKLFTTDQKLTGREQADLTGLIGQYAHGNEPSHHIPYLFNYSGLPWLTQMYARKIMDEFYKNAPDGLIGNEDCGQMSAWYVLSASGFYPVTPGSPEYALGTPLFPEMKYHLENGRIFVVRARNLSDKNFYVSAVNLNETRKKVPSLLHDEIMMGGVLEFSMTNAPISAFSNLPRTGNPVKTVAAPWIRGFMGSATSGAKIYFTIDGTEPTEKSIRYYGAPITGYTSDVKVIKAIAIDANGNRSKVVEQRVYRRPDDWTVKVTSGYSTQYTGGGENAIIDGIRGTTNFASGEWQGVQGKPYEAVVDLQRETEIKSVGASFLQVAGPWIWMPDSIEFEVSSDGVNFTPVAEIKPAFPQREMMPTIREYRQKITRTKARYVRMRAYNFGQIPSWHPGAGGDPWIFIDEIFIH